MGFEGANVLFDDIVHPLTMGLEEHLLTMFRDDFEFHDGAGASHLGPGHLGPGHTPPPVVQIPAVAPAAASNDGAVPWSAEAERELKKIPFFVRGKARKNTETFAAEQGLASIELATLYEAKAHYAR
jgi:light-independent protochlorophyllide reductase subunit B